MSLINKRRKTSFVSRFFSLYCNELLCDSRSSQELISNQHQMSKKKFWSSHKAFEVESAGEMTLMMKFYLWFLNFCQLWNIQFSGVPMGKALKKCITTSIWCENMLGYLFADFVCSEKRAALRAKLESKVVSFEEQITSKDKCPSYFCAKWRLFCLLSIFRNTRSFENWGIFPQFRWWSIQPGLTCLDQKRQRGNIKPQG